MDARAFRTCVALWQTLLMLPRAVGFTLVYAAVSWLVLAAYPQSAGFWAGDAIVGHRLFGLPVEELIWAATFGATWPAVLGYCLNGQLTWPVGKREVESEIPPPARCLRQRRGVSSP